MAKFDLNSAFRMLLVHPHDWELLEIQWRGSYYVDTCLPFGFRSAPFLFNQVATALEWILKANYHITHLIHYQDDYFMAGSSTSPLCGEHLQCFHRTALRLVV